MSLRKPLDPHFAPINQHCNPCRVQYGLVGKMETFVDDTRAILNAVNVDLNHITGATIDFDHENDISIISDVIKRTSRYLRRSNPSCLSQNDVLKTIWLTFQTRGFISTAYPFPSELLVKDSNSTLEIFEALAKSASRSSFTSNDQRRRQREEAMLLAFGSVPASVLEQLASAFNKDCELFDYSCNITDRFLKNL
ncbi:carbohydrate sulfotransferase [Plakobranchus ocellatus]|uniref:Carbohydrate sulfotransferase n=1 Tax=Plakobranchus ocellatus TaxID=259542 RepID=A0AAV4CVK7_9GAST|nr:carbohydrate sulfotransferase [Plakobranchus ocellatus]